MSRRGENIYKRKDGRYEGRYVIGKTESGKTRFGYVYGWQYTQVRGELIRRKAVLESNRGPKLIHSMTVEKWMDIWLSGEIKRRIKASSIQTYQRLYRLHIKPLLGNLDLAKVSAADLYSFLAELEKKGLSGATQKSILRLLSAAMRSAMEDDLILRNPCAKIRICSRMQEQRVLTLAEQRQLKETLIDSADLPALLALYTGMRLGEICALEWADVDFEARTIAVRHTVQRIESKGAEGSAPKTAMYISSPKSLTSRRLIPAPQFVLDLLRPMQAGADSPYVFGKSGRAAEPRTIQRRFKKAAQRLSISGVHFHTTRHTFATRMLEIGVDVKTVSAMLGHSSAKTTLDFYAHSLIDQQRRAMDAMAERI